MWTERCLSRIIIQHYWHRHTPPEFTKTHKISMVFSSQFLLATFCLVISRLLDHVRPDFLFAKRSSILARLVTDSSVVSCRDVTGPEKCWEMLSTSCFMESRNDKLLESFMSQLRHSALLFFLQPGSFSWSRRQGTQRERQRLWTLAAAFLLSKPHPYFSQNVSFYFSAVAIVTFHDLGLRPFMKETVNINGEL